jgi:lysine N-acyltransferase
MSDNATRQATPVGPPPVPLMSPPWGVRVIEPDGADLRLVWRWMNEPHVASGWHQDWSESRWADELAGQLAGDRSIPCLLSYDGEVVAYQEYYRVARDPLGALYRVHPHDLGLHTCIGVASNTGRGLGSALLRAAARGLLAADPDCVRVVGEPNAENQAAVRACLRAGYRHWGEVQLPHKKAALMTWSYGEQDDPRLPAPPRSDQPRKGQA